MVRETKAAQIWKYRKQKDYTGGGQNHLQKKEEHQKNSGTRGGKGGVTREQLRTGETHHNPTLQKT